MKIQLHTLTFLLFLGSALPVAFSTEFITETDPQESKAIRTTPMGADSGTPTPPLIAPHNNANTVSAGYLRYNHPYPKALSLKQDNTNINASQARRRGGCPTLPTIPEELLLKTQEDQLSKLPGH